jgi:Helix-turn-helix domain
MSRLSVKEAAAYIPCPESTLNKLRLTGGGPRFIKLTKRVLYDTRDLDQWLEDHKLTSTCDVQQKKWVAKRDLPAHKANRGGTREGLRKVSKAQRTRRPREGLGRDS